MVQFWDKRRILGLDVFPTEGESEQSGVYTSIKNISLGYSCTDGCYLGQVCRRKRSRAYDERPRLQKLGGVETGPQPIFVNVGTE